MECVKGLLQVYIYFALLIITPLKCFLQCWCFYSRYVLITNKCPLMLIRLYTGDSTQCICCYVEEKRLTAAVLQEEKLLVRVLCYHDKSVLTQC